MNSYCKMTAAEAAELVQDGQTVAFSGFTPAGAPKDIPHAIGERAKRIHAEGFPFQIGVITGASTGKSLDGALALADAVKFRTPYQSDPNLRKSINEGRTQFFDMHLSMAPQNVRYGFLGPVNYAVIEACDISDSGEPIKFASTFGTLAYPSAVIPSTCPVRPSETPKPCAWKIRPSASTPGISNSSIP